MSEQVNFNRDHGEMPESIGMILPPGSTFQWIRQRTLAASISRLIYGDGEIDQESSSADSRFTPGDQETMVDPRFLNSFHQRSRPFSILEVMEKLSMFDIDSSLSPLKVLQVQVHNIFFNGLEAASHVCCRIQSAAIRNSHQVESDLMYLRHPPLNVEWRSCKLASATVLLFATPKERLSSTLRFNSRICGGLPTLDEIRRTPTASFISEYSKAKLAAEGPLKRTTVICVSLADVHIFELAKIGRSEGYSSFAHSFVIGIGPEGVVIWQAWGEHGYRLDEYLERNGDRIRSWSEADRFVKDFESLVGKNRGPWNSKRNELYKRCFEVDIQKICGGKGQQRPIVPKIENWVRLFVIEDVKVDDLKKFEWV